VSTVLPSTPATDQPGIRHSLTLKSGAAIDRASLHENLSMQTPRKSLSDILGGDNAARLQVSWDEAEVAADLKPLPSGEYTARVLSGELFNARSGTPGYKLTMEVTEGEHAGRKLWHDVWLTPPAMPMTKRDLGKLGITDFDQLDSPLPAGMLVRVKVALRRDEDGTEFNRVKTFDFIGVEKGDAFEPEPNDTSEADTSFDVAEIEAGVAASGEPTGTTPDMTRSANGTSSRKEDKQP